MATSDIVKKLQATIMAVGPSGIKRIPRYFRYFDADGNKTISPDELKKCFSTSGVQVSDSEMLEVFRLFDRDGSGKIDVMEFTKTLEPKLNDQRTGIVKKYFKAMDKTGDGVISVDDLKNKHGGNESDIQTFLQKFEVYEHKDGKVTLDEFSCYYACMGVSVDNDAAFEKLLSDDWGKV